MINREFPFNQPIHPVDNLSINKAFDRNYGNKLKSGDTTTLKYTIKDGDGEPLDKDKLIAMEKKAILKYDNLVAYETFFDAEIEGQQSDYDGDLVARFKVEEVLPPSDKPYIVEFHFEDAAGEERYIFPSNNKLELFVTPSALNADDEAIVRVSEQKLDEAVAKKLESNIILKDAEEQELQRQAAEAERQANYDELVETGIMQENINQKLAASEAEYAPRLTSLEQNDAELTAQLAQKAQQLEQLGIIKADKSDIDDFNSRIDQIITTPTDLISEQEIIDARQNKASLGENLMTLKDNLKTILEPTGEDNKEYTLQNGRFGSAGIIYQDGAFLRYNEYFGGYGVNGVIRNTNPNEYNFDVIFYDHARNFIKRDRGITNSKYVVDEKYLFRVAISRADGASIVESDRSEMHDAFFISDRLDITGNISGNIDLGNNKNVKLENIVEKQRIIYPYPASFFHLEKVDGVAVYVKFHEIMVRNYSATNIRFNQRDINEPLSEYIADSPSGVKDCIRIPQKKSLVYDVPENTLKIVEWGGIETTHDLLLLINHGDLFGALVDFVRGKTLEENSNKIEDISVKVDALSSTDKHVKIPAYWNEHIERKVDIIREKQLSLGNNGYTFGFITDIHYNPRNTGYKVSSPYIMSKVMEECDIKLFVNGGDMGNQQNGEEGRKTILSDYYELIGLFKRAGIIDKMLPMVGNHESNTQNWSLGNGAFNNVVVHNDEVYSVLFRNTEKIPNINYGGDGLYYYVDDFANQIRHIILNTNDVEYTESKKIDYAIKQQQFDWLINEALELPSPTWSVILATHIPPVTQDFSDRGMPVKNMEILKGIIRAFKDKSQFSDSENHSNSIYNTSVSVDFTNNENEFIVWIAGHHHRDHVTLVDNSYTVVLTADDGRRNSDNPIKTVGTDTEHVMDFFTVDKISKKVFITRVGAGEDREFTY